MQRHLIIAALLASPVAAFGQVAPKPTDAQATCAAFNASIDLSEKRLSEELADGLTDNSAPRATLRELRALNEWGQIKLAIDLMRDHRCAMPKRVPIETRYITQAIECSRARLTNRTTSTPPQCDKATWKSE